MLARLSSPEKYHSLLDALCISPVSKPLALSYLQSSRKPTGSIRVQKTRYCRSRNGKWWLAVKVLLSLTLNRYINRPGEKTWELICTQFWINCNFSAVLIYEHAILCDYISSLFNPLWHLSLAHLMFGMKLWVIVLVFKLQ